MSETLGLQDAADLKVQIRKLKADRGRIDQEQRDLLQDVEDKEAKLTSLKQELNLALVTSDARNSTEDSANDYIAPEAAKKLRILSDKLDMRIISQEIRTALPQLEKNAEAWERRSRGMKKDSHRNQREQQRFPSVLLQPVTIAEDQAGDIVEMRAKLKQSMKKETDSRKAVKAALCSEIGSLRRQLAALQTEHGAARSAHIRVQWALQEEEHRLALLQEEHREVRDTLIGSSVGNSSGEQQDSDSNGLIRNADIGQGWQLQAFLEIARECHRISSSATAAGANDAAAAASTGLGFAADLKWAMEIEVPMLHSSGGVHPILSRVLQDWVFFSPPSLGPHDSTREDPDTDLLCRRNIMSHISAIWKQQPHLKPATEPTYGTGNGRNSKYANTATAEEEDLGTIETISESGTKAKATESVPTVLGLATFCLLCDRLLREDRRQQDM